MGRITETFSNLFSREREELSPESDRTRREITGSIFTLLTLFELVALTSYLPFDSYNLYAGQLDQMNNLGGIVGAVLGEALLGMTGVVGYVIVLMTAWLSVCAFRGITVAENRFRILGTVIGTLLGAMALQLLFADTDPDTSLLHGGHVGHYAGTFLRTYFNTTGSLLIVCGGLFFTIFFTAGLSLTGIYEALFGSKEGESDDDGESEDDEQDLVAKPVLKTVPTVAPIAAAPQEAAAKPKRKRNKKAAATEGLVAVDENGAPIALNPDGDGEAAAEAPPTTGDISFKEMIPWDGSYAEPGLRLLKNAPGGVKRLTKGEARDIADSLVEHLLSFQITGEITAVSQGPVLTTYEFKPTAGVKLSKIAALQDDLGVVLGTQGLRIVAPIPGKTVVGIEVPRPQAEIIALKDVLAEDEFRSKKMRLPFTIGKTTDGRPVFADMAATPHLLVAGATGSGKSVFVNSLIMSFLFRCSPQELRLILIDPKMLELNAFDGLPHLITNVITDNTKAYHALNWAVQEMDRRYALMAQTGSKNIDSYNEKQKGKGRLPFIVVIVDELADLMMSGGQAVEVAITRLAQKARAAGIHMVLATQRPSTDVVTGLIKANIPSRLSFKVPSGVDSRTVLDAGGAEELMGRGDSLMIQPGIPMRRLHGVFVTEEELHRVVKYAKGGKDHSKYYIDFSGGSIPKK